MILKECHNFDVLIIGSGGAGLSAAIALNDKNINNIAIISKSSPNISHTVAAKGGINAALGNVDDDNYKYHIYDTIKSGDYICDYDMVEKMCKNAPDIISKLQKIGVEFTKSEDGKIYQRKYGGQTLNFGGGRLSHRVCCVSDKTGYEIQNNLYRHCLSKDNKFFEYSFIFDLLIKDGKCYGAIAFDMNLGQINIFHSKIVIIAAGGYNQIYEQNTSIANFSGDLIAATISNNLPVQDMEFVQFHPTCLYDSNILISEAARGEGGILTNNKGERFMTKYAPKYGDLASRDIVARAMAMEIYNGNGAGKNNDHLWLDISHLDPKIIQDRLSETADSVKLFAEIDVFSDKIPVVPAAHYTMGGIPTNENCQIIDIDKDGTETTIDNVFAIGESACHSVHGANRLGCNSLLDIIIFGNMSGNFIAQNIDNYQLEDLPEDVIAKHIENISNLFGDKKNNISLDKIQNKIKKINQRNIGIFRNKKLLDKALRQLLKLQEYLVAIKINDDNLKFNSELISYFEVKNLLKSSIMTCFSALNRTESRGSHFRNDYPNRDDNNFRCHSIVKKDKNGQLYYQKRKVRDKFTNEDITIKPNKRAY